MEEVEHLPCAGLREDAGYCLRLQLPPRDRKVVSLRGWGGWCSQLLAAEGLSALWPPKRMCQLKCLWMQSPNVAT